MAIPIEQMSFKPSSATGSVARPFSTRMAEPFLSVKDFGALGNDSNNDTSYIQACFDAAFGTWASPNGITNAKLNIPVYFPPGTYRVQSAIAAATVTGSAADAGEIKLTVSTTSGLAVGDMIYVRGVLGTTEANGSWSIRTLDATHVTLRNSVFTNAWSAGGTQTICPPALRLKSVYGGLIYGGGKGCTSISGQTTSAAVLSTNGFQYCSIRNMGFGGGPTGIGLDLNCDGNQLTDCSNNLIENCYLGNSGTQTDYACAVGMGGDSGYNNTFLACFIGTGAVAGISFHNDEAIGNAIEGGNFAIGGNPPNVSLLVVKGSCPSIIGIGFQTGVGVDVDIQTTAAASYAIHGCRSESDNFLRLPTTATNTLTAHVAGTCMTNNSAPGTGFFFSGGGAVTIDACYSPGGHFINGTNASVIVNACYFGDTTFLTDGGSENFKYLSVFPIPIVTVTTSVYSILSSDGGAKVQFNRASAQTVTLNKNSDNTCNLNTGTQIYVQQIGAGQTTFAGAAGVTINSPATVPGGLKLRVQYSCATLTCDGSDTWTLSGDTTT